MKTEKSTFSFDDIDTFIMAKATREELDAIARLVTIRRQMISERAKSSLCVGDAVKFKSTRTGELVTGRIAKINRKFIDVKETGTLNRTWRVSPVLLQRA